MLYEKKCRIFVESMGKKKSKHVYKRTSKTPKLYNFGSWVGEHAGELGTLAGAGIGAGLGTMVGNPIMGMQLGATLGGKVGNLAEEGYTEAHPSENQLAYQKEQMDLSNVFKQANKPAYFKMGGRICKYGEGGQVEINVEKNELEVKPSGAIVADFKNKPKHPSDPSLIDPKGNTVASTANFIIPAKFRDRYLTGDGITKKTIMRRVMADKQKSDKAVPMLYKTYKGFHKMKEGGPLDYLKFNPNFEDTGNDPESILPDGSGFNPLGSKGFTAEQMANPVLQDFLNSGGNAADAESYMAFVNESGQPSDMPVNNGAPSVERQNQVLGYAKSQLTPPAPAAKTGEGYQWPVSPNAPNMAQSTPVASGLPGKPPVVTNSKFDANKALNAFGTYAPTAYDIGMGLTAKAHQYKYGDYSNKQRMPYRDVNFNSIRQAIEQQGSIARKNAQQGSAGSGGSYMSNALQAGANTQNAIATAMMNADRYNAEGRNSADSANMNLEARNNQLRFMLDTANRQNKAKKTEYLGRGLEGLSSATQMSALQNNMQGRDQQMLELYKQIFPFLQSYKG